MADVRLRGERAEVEAGRDLVVGQALGDERQDFALALGDPRQIASGARAIRAATLAGALFIDASTTPAAGSRPFQNYRARA